MEHTQTVIKHTVVLLILTCALAGCARGAPELTEVAAVEGFVAPESVYWDEETDTWFVGNIGAPDVLGDGFISQLEPDGTVRAQQLIRGLDDPKGIRVHDGVLYVADRTALARVRLDLPSEVERLEAPGAMFLNDVAVDRASGDVFVSDTLGNALYRLQGDTISELLRTPDLETPNGLLVRGGALIIASLGPNLNPETFETEAPGRLFTLDLETLALSPLSERFGLLDGLEPLATGFLVSDYQVGLYYVDRAGSAEMILDNVAAGLQSSADIGHAERLKRIAVPDLVNGTRVVFYDYERPME